MTKFTTSTRNFNKFAIRLVMSLLFAIGLVFVSVWCASSFIPSNFGSVLAHRLVIVAVCVPAAFVGAAAIFWAIFAD